MMLSERHSPGPEDSFTGMAQRTSSGIRFWIPEGFCFRYETLTNRIIPEDGLQRDGAKAENGNARLALGLGEIGYGAPLAECLEMPDGGMESLTLEITRQCNCRCVYCLYSGAYDNRRLHSDNAMSSQTLSSALRFYKRHNRKCSEAHVSFYGGEALLAFPAIRGAVKEAADLFVEKPLSFTISTNGLLLEESAVKWLADNPGVSVVVTVNGPRHDDYRVTRQGTPTLGRIVRNLAAIRERFPAVWSKQIKFICNVASLSEIRPLRDFYRESIGKTPILITGIHASHGDRSIDEIVRPGRASRTRLWHELAEEYMDTGDPFLHILFRSRIRHVSNRSIFKESAPAIAANCIPFLSNCFVSSDGSINLCEKNCEMSLGDVENGIDAQKVRTLMENAQMVFNLKCRRCWAQRLCSICFADMDNLLNGNAGVSDERCLRERGNIVSDLAIFTEFTLFHPELFDRLYGDGQNKQSGRRRLS